ncbi:hypothetical protein D3OALGA1CA_5750 [Olavius algarvensis associated proteobacterium Delta 3]|nr:hypothetical protein D3OALGB2SA_2423 [Olavius algarvensis associated proteobacterium Delta 3]CAB5171246.1 hypothetical protein D3OALGA1CA_5750 [Olavius algarvensis associated proteobacterium Delta 3]
MATVRKNNQIVTDNFFHDIWDGDQYNHGIKGDALEVFGGTGHYIARNLFEHNVVGLLMDNDSSGRIEFNVLLS